METKDLYADLNTSHGKLLRRNLYARAITALNDHHGILPLAHLEKLTDRLGRDRRQRGQSLPVGLAALCARGTVPLRQGHRKDAGRPAATAGELRPGDRFGAQHLVAREQGLRYPGDVRWTSCGRSPRARPTIFALFANPYRVARPTVRTTLPSVMVAYEETEDTQDLMAQAIFGAIAWPRPVAHHGIVLLQMWLMVWQLKANGRFAYTMPEALGMPELDLNGR